MLANSKRKTRKQLRRRPRPLLRSVGDTRTIYRSSTNGSGQYTAMATPAWSAGLRLDTLTSTVRLSCPTVDFCGGKVIFRATTIASQIVTYRIIVYQLTNRSALQPTPDLMYTGTPTVSNFWAVVPFTKRDQSYPFSVRYDQLVVHDTNYGHDPLTKEIIIKIPKHQSQYDPDDSTGATVLGEMQIGVLTDATAASANFTYVLSVLRKWKLRF